MVLVLATEGEILLQCFGGKTNSSEQQFMPGIYNIWHSVGSRVKSGKFGHQVNSDTHLQTVEIPD